MDTNHGENTLRYSIFMAARRAVWLLGLFLFIVTGGAQEQFQYVTNGEFITITGYTGTDQSVLIPQYIGYRQVTRIGDDAFFGRSGLTNVTFQSGISSIGSFAFAGCAGLTDINLPYGVTNIGSYAFSGCAGLTKVTISASVTRIESYAFGYCANLGGVYFRGDAPTVGANAFASDGSLTVYFLPGATGWGATFGARPTVLQPVSPDEFLYETNNAEITINGYVGPGGVVAIPGTINGFPVTEINGLGNGRGGDLLRVVIPSEVVSLNTAAFSYQYNLAAITVDALNPNFSSVDGVLFSKNQQSLIRYPINRTGRYTIPAAVTNVGGDAFSNCSELTGVTLGSGIVAIGVSAFQFCYNLEGVTLPDSVTSIGYYAFAYCSKLDAIAIGKNVTNIDFFAFGGCEVLRSIIVDPLNPEYCSVDGVLFDKNRATLIQCPAGKTGDYTIPSGVENIAEYALRECTQLTGVAIPNSVTNIGYAAFSTCLGLKRLTIPNSVTRIESGAFASCYNLTEVTIPDSLTRINEETFFFCSSLTNVTIPDSVKSIGFDAFYQCSSLKSVTFPNGLTNIEGYAFSGCRKLTEVILPNSVVGIDQYTFFGCTSLTNVTIPTGATYLGEYSFASCESLVRLKLPGSLVDIGYAAFSDCSSLGNVIIPDGITILLHNIFDGCSSLTNVFIPNGVTRIEANAFSGCSRLNGVRIPQSVTYIGERAFSQYPVYGEMYFDGNAPVVETNAFENLGGIVFPGPGGGGVGGVIIGGGGGFGGGSVIPTINRGVTFANLSALTITAYYPFYYLPGKTGWGESIGGRPTQLRPQAEGQFYYSAHNGTVTITGYGGPGGEITIPSMIDGQRVTDIAFAAFAACTNLTGITIPNTVRNVGDYAFGNCANLTTMNFEGDSPVSGADVFLNTDNVLVYYAPGTSGWGTTFGGRPAMLPLELQFTYVSDGTTVTITGYTGPGGSVAVPGSINGLPVLRIENSTFVSCYSLTNLTIPNSVTSVGGGAFYDCTNLATVKIGKNLTTIEDGTFRSCIRLTSIVIDELNPFYSSNDGVLFDKLQTTVILCPLGKAGGYTIPYGVTEIGNFAFGSCVWLSEVTVPGSVTNIGDLAFAFCSGLTNVVIPGSVARVGYAAFAFCEGLTKVAIASGVREIGVVAFYGVTNLTDVMIPDSVTNLGENAFGGCSVLMAIGVNSFNLNFSSVDGVLYDHGKTTILCYPAGRVGSYAIPGNVTSIGGSAFNFCDRLTGIAIPDSVTTIGYYSFYGCGGLTNITIPKGVRTISDFALGACTNLTVISVDALNSIFASVDGVLFDHGVTTLIQCPSGKAGGYLMPDTVMRVGWYAFDSCAQLTRITIPRSVIEIEGRAFASCLSLTAIYFEGNAPNVAGDAFIGANYGTVYYLGESAGWEPMFAGLPTEVWRPEARTDDLTLGVQGNQFGFNISWARGREVVVEACTNLFNPEWIPVKTNTISGDSVYFSDPEFVNHPGRFYRFRSP